MAAPERFEVLDSFRGIAACLVALYHFQVSSHFQQLDIVVNAHLFVDFFFVLSGFVIATSYEKRLLSGFGGGRFILLRFGRVYPLHLFFLVVWVAWWALFLGNGFDDPKHAPFTVFTNLLLIHSLGVHEFLTWNYPSWSISVEFATYVAFAGALALLRRRLWIALALAVMLAPIVLTLIDRDYEAINKTFGIVKSVGGFAAGVLCHRLYTRLTVVRVKERLGRFAFSALEIASVLVGLAFVTLAPPEFFVLSPFVFSIVIFVHSMEGGAVSCVLSSRPLLFLGTLSYSIYMAHAFVYELWVHFTENFKASRRFLSFLDESALRLGFDKPDIRHIEGDILSVVMLAMTVALAYLTYRAVEKPGQRLFRRFADAFRSPNAPRAANEP